MTAQLTLSTDAQERLAARDFPTTLDDPRLGLSGDPLLAELVHRVLSRAAIDPIDRRGHAVVHILGDVLRIYAAKPVPEGDPPAPFAELADVELTSASAARRLLGITFDDEREMWDALDGRQRVWPVEQLCAYVPPPLWRVVEHLIVGGREHFANRMTAALREEAKRPLTRRNPKRLDGGAGAVSPAWVTGLRARAAHLVTPLYELAVHARFADLLAEGGWNLRSVSARELGAAEGRAATRGASSKSQGAVTDTAAPPLRLVRLRFAELDARVRHELGSVPGDDEPRLIAALPEKKVTRELEALLRDRLLVLWLPRFAQRAGAFPYLSEACLDLDHRFLDGEVGPGVLVFDPKTPTSAQWRWRPFERELVPFIEAYLAVKRRRRPSVVSRDWKTPVGDTADLIDVPRPAREKLARTGRPIDTVAFRSPALFRVGSFSALTADALLSLCTGASGRQQPLVPRPDDPDRGYNSHALARHLYRGQVSSEGARRWCARHDQDPDRRDIWGEMGMDHALVGLDSLYKDDDSDLGRERGTRLGGRVVYELLTTDLGLRTHPDGDTYKQALEARDATEEELRRIEADFERQAERIERDGKDVPVSAIVPLLRRQAESARLRRELVELDRTIMGIEAGHEDYLVTVADDVPHDQIPRVDLASIKRDHRHGVPEGRLKLLREEHNWHCGEDFVDLGLGKTATVRGWMKDAIDGKVLPPKCPFPADAVFVFPEDSRRRAVYAEAVHFKTQEQRDMAAAQRADEPRAGWEHLTKKVPDPRGNVAGGRALRAA